MILVFGGAYQGKREFAQELFAARCAERGVAGAAPVTFDCRALTEEVALAALAEADIIAGLEHFTWLCCTEDPRARRDAAQLLRSHRGLWIEPTSAGFTETPASSGTPAGFGTTSSPSGAPAGSSATRNPTEALASIPPAAAQTFVDPAGAPAPSGTGSPTQQKIFLITDVSQSVVPIEERTRAFREMNGRLMTYLASEAEEVWRVFCGIGKRIK